MISAVQARAGFVPAAYSRDVASVRLRCLRPHEILSERGVRTRILPIDGELDVDVLVLVKAYEAKHLSLARRAVAAGTAVIFDLCDNHLWPPATDAAGRQRQARLREMLELADVVTVPTPELAEAVGCSSAVVVPDALETFPNTGRLAGARFNEDIWGRRTLRLLWFGNAGSERQGFGLVDLTRISSDIESLASRRRLKLTVVSNDWRQFRRCLGRARFPKQYVRWNRRSFPTVARRHDICLLPATLNPFTRSKSPNRLATAFQLGLPAVVSELPSYVRFSDHVLVEDWVPNIERYADDRALRRSHVAGGVDAVRARFGDDVIASSWLHAMSCAIERRST